MRQKMLTTSKAEILSRLDAYMTVSEPIQKLISELQAMNAEIDALPDSNKKDEISRNRDIIKQDLKTKISEDVILKAYEELNGEFAMIIQQAGALANSWAQAWMEFSPTYQMSQFPQISCRNTVVSKLIRG